MEREMKHCSSQVFMREQTLNVQEGRQPKLKKSERDRGLKLLKPPPPLVALSLLISPPLVSALLSSNNCKYH